MERGVIASPLSFKFNMTGFKMSTELTPEVMRYYLMYWDKVVVPDNNLFSVELPDEKDLVSHGSVLRPKTSLSGSFDSTDIGVAIMRSQVEWMNFFRKDPNVDWVLHQSDANQIYLPKDETIERDLLRMRLTNVLPVPDKNTPINEVLEFREYRRGQLGALHAAIDEMYMEVLKQPDRALAEKQVTCRLKDAIDDLDKVSKERFGFFHKFSIEPQFSLSGKDMLAMGKELLKGGGAGGAGDVALHQGLVDNPIANYLASFEFPIITATGLAVGLASAVSLSIGTKPSPKVGGKHHLSYLAKASDVGIIKF